MTVIDSYEGMSQPVATTDLEGLDILRDNSEEALANDVQFVRGEAVRDIIERSGSIAQKIIRGIGSASADETIRIGLINVSDEERLVLESARRVAPKRIY